ncbi:MAG: hypothetical protein ACRDPY_38550 [Streptosporangiaceae bacterium]
MKLPPHDDTALPLHAALRAWARGIYPDEAGVELLIGHATFLHRSDFTGVSHFWRGPAGSRVI